MAFDGNFCYALTNELKSLIGGKIEKIHHSGNACIELVVYTQKRTGVLVLSALPSAPYVSLTEIAGEH
ncbi:MAG: NFACT family protein, partial [Clostridia bacterium]